MTTSRVRHWRHAAVTWAVVALGCLPPPVVTFAKYNTLVEGMSYAQVQEVVGVPGVEVGSSKVASGAGEIAVKTFMWSNRNGGSLTAVFHNGQLVTKSQFGLP